MESFAASSTHLAEAARHLVRAGERRHRPQERHPPERVGVELRANGGRRGGPERELRSRRHHSYEAVARVGDGEMSRAKQREARGSAEPRARAVAVAEPDTSSGRRPNRAATNRHDASGFIGDVEFAVGASRDTDGPDEPVAACPHGRGRAPLLVHGADEAVPGIGDVDDAARVKREPRGRIEARAVRHAITRTRTLRAGERPDHAARLDHADAIVVGVGDDHATIGGHHAIHQPLSCVANTKLWSTNPPMTSAGVGPTRPTA